jgi:uncharacterized protein YndB with AHSA1/START domain
MGKQKVTVNRERREIIMERTFDAPRDLVWKVIADPKLIPQWWGPRSTETVVDKMEFKKGGTWRFVQKDPGGAEYAFNGVYQDIKAPERIVYSFNFEPIGPGHELTEEMTLEEQGEKTKVTSKAMYRTLEDLEGMLKSGMEEGANETMDRLEEVLNRMK